MSAARWGLTAEQMVAFDRGVAQANAAKQDAISSGHTPLIDVVRAELGGLSVAVEPIGSSQVFVHSDDCLARAVDRLVPLGVQVFVGQCEMDGEHLVVARAETWTVGPAIKCGASASPAERSDGRAFSYWLTELVEREAAER